MLAFLELLTHYRNGVSTSSGLNSKKEYYYSTFLGLIDPEEGGTVTLQKVGNYLPIDMV